MLLRLALSALAALLCAGNAHADVLFRCPDDLAALQHQTADYLHTLAIPAEQIVQTVDTKSGVFSLALATPAQDVRTLDLHNRPEYALATERVNQPATDGKVHIVNTVSKKEIMLALLQHGRTTTFEKQACSVEALSDHIGIRQNIVAWSEHMHLVWPDGGAAKWNEKLWTRGTPNPGITVHEAVMDVFLHQNDYVIGCYTAAKLVVVQGVLDYYNRIKNDPLRTRRVEDALLADGDPLVGIEPGNMWSFEKDFDAHNMQHTGKLLQLASPIPSGNFIPGDWSYLLNTDPGTQNKTGYEGSNVIYLGRNRFDDFYDDHHHSYTYEQKLDEVYQWRNGVFSRQRHADKVKPLSAEELSRLGDTPEKGGLQLDTRAVPRFF